MPNPTEISLLNYNLEAKACNELLTAMLNHSDLDEEKLRLLMQTIVTESTLNEYGRFDALLATVDKGKAKAYFEKLDGKPIPPPKVNPRVSKLLREFILSGGFDIT